MYFFGVWHFSIISFTFTACCSSISQIPAFKHTALHIAVLYRLRRSSAFPFNRFFMLKMKLCFSPISPRLCQKAFRRRKFLFRSAKFYKSLSLRGMILCVLSCLLSVRFLLLPFPCFCVILQCFEDICLPPANRHALWNVF